MKRRSFFGVVAGGICAALGVKAGNCQEMLDGPPQHDHTSMSSGLPEGFVWTLKEEMQPGEVFFLDPYTGDPNTVPAWPVGQILAYNAREYPIPPGWRVVEISGGELT